MKLFVCYKTHEVIWPDYVYDFIEESKPVKFIEHVPGCGFGLGPHPFEPTDDEDSNLRECCGDIFTLVDVDEYDNGLLLIDGEVYEERGGLVFEYEESEQ